MKQNYVKLHRWLGIVDNKATEINGKLTLTLIGNTFPGTMTSPVETAHKEQVLNAFRPDVRKKCRWDNE